MWQMKMKRLSQSFLILITMILVACGPATNQVVIPPDQLGTAIVETSAALASQTALYAPPIQFVASDTAVPTMVNTDLPTMTLLPTYTSFLVIVPSNTATITPTKTATETPLATKTLNQPCVVAAQIPANNTQFTTGAFFDTIWTLVNTGSVTWAAGNVDFAFSSGTKMYLNGVTLLDIPATTAPNQSVAFTVHMQAPQTKGTFTDTWVLREGSVIYCTASVTIVVK
jgi:hypothetical protein